MARVIPQMLLFGRNKATIINFPSNHKFDIPSYDYTYIKMLRFLTQKCCSFSKNKV